MFAQVVDIGATQIGGLGNPQNIEPIFNIVNTPGNITAAEAAFVARVAGNDVSHRRSFVSFGNFNIEKNAFGFKNPLSNKIHQAEATRIQYEDENNFSWSGKLAEEGSFFTLIRNPGGTIGMIKDGNRFYFIHPVAPEISVFTFVKNEASAEIECGASHSSTSNSSMGFCDEDLCHETIDALMVWTPGALEFLNGVGNPFIQWLYVLIGRESINQAFHNSSIAGEIRFQSTNFDFPLSADIAFDINSLVLDPDIIALRNQHSADIVILMTDQVYFNAATGNQIFGAVPSIGPIQNQAFAIVEVPFLMLPRWTLAHEVGHLLGARHNRQSNGGNDNTNICSHAWRFTDDDGEERRGILAALGDEVNGRELFYSNPSRTFNGAPTGTEDNNNAGRIISSVCAVNDFRPNAFMTARIEGSPKMCTCLTNPLGTFYFDFREYAAIAEGGILDGGPPPYIFQWFKSFDGINLVQWLGNGPNISFDPNPIQNCDEFYLHLRVTSTVDGRQLNDVMRINTYDCPECDNWDACFNRPDINVDTREANIKNQNPVIVAEFNDDLFLSPNPANEEIVISYKVRMEERVKTYISDSTGKVVSIVNDSPIKSGEYVDIVNIDALPKGIYILVQEKGNKILTQKFIKL